MPSPFVSVPKKSVTQTVLHWLSPLIGDFPITTQYGAPAALGGGIHWGVDFGAKEGTPIYAPRDAKIKRADGSDPGGGNIVQLDFGDGYTMLFAHLRNFVVGQGESVKAGEIVGYVGSTGELVTGAHLHVEAEKNGTKINPLDLLDPFQAADKDEYSNAARRVEIQADGNCPKGYHRRDDGFFGIGSDMKGAYCERDNFLGDVVSGPLDAGKNVALALAGVIQFFVSLFDPANWAAWGALAAGSMLSMFGLYMVWSAT